MNYTRYFASITKEIGQPNLSADQFRRMMNIVHVEGVIRGMRVLKEKDSDRYFKYDTIIFKNQALLSELTGDLLPKDILHEMVRLSK